MEVLEDTSCLDSFIHSKESAIVHHVSNSWAAIVAGANTGNVSVAKRLAHLNRLFVLGFRFVIKEVIFW